MTKSLNRLHGMFSSLKGQEGSNYILQLILQDGLLS